MPEALRRTPLFNAQATLGARFVPFGGWEMPVQFSGILEEHRVVRSAAGIFDISHMGQLRVCGTGAADWLDSLLTNAIKKLRPGLSQYTFLLNDQGGVIDDLIVYQTDSDEFLLVINAAVAARDIEWLRSHMPTTGVVIEDLSPTSAALALQGPAAPAIFAAAFDATCPGRRTIQRFVWEGLYFSAAGTGYTGEAGCELFCAGKDVEKLFARLLAAGASHGIKPCGLGARDTLRLEMAYPLNGRDLLPTRSPVEADLALFVSATKDAVYPGRMVVESHLKKGPPSLLTALILEAGAPPPRAGYSVLAEGEKISDLTSGALSPTLGLGLCLSYLPPHFSNLGTQLEIEIRGRRFPAKTVAKPFYNPQK